MLRFWAAGSLALSALAFSSLSACVNPKTDYDDYLARTADAETTIPTGDASFDGLSGDAGFQNQSYVMACVSQSFNDSVTEPTLFVATASFMPTDSTGDGTFNFTDQALVVGATDTTDLAPGGSPTPINGSAVTGGKVDVVFGPTSVPAAADPIMEGPIVFSDDTLHFYIGPGVNLCAGLSGHTTEPLVTTLTADQNICVFFPFEGATGQVPALTQAEFHCP